MTMMNLVMTGVYRISIKNTMTFYVGESSDISKRIRFHKRDLKDGKHSNKKLQSDWDKYGASAFSYMILFEGFENDRYKRMRKEQWYIDDYLKQGIPVYNCLENHQYEKENCRDVAESRDAYLDNINEKWDVVVQDKQFNDYGDYYEFGVVRGKYPTHRESRIVYAGGNYVKCTMIEPYREGGRWIAIPKPR